MVDTGPVQVPLLLAARFDEFAAEHKHGNITVNYKDGYIISWTLKITERDMSEGLTMETPPK